MKLIRCILVTTLLSMLLPGCWGAKEIEHMIYVNTLGVDYVDNKVVVYIQMVNFSGIAKKEAGQTQEQKTFIGKAEGDSFDTAIFNLYASSPQRIVWSNVKTIVFSEAALKNGDVIEQVLEVWDRYYEFRYTVWTMATKESVEKVLNTPSITDLSVIYSQLNSPMRSYEQSSIIAPLYLYKFIWKWKEKGETVLLPYLKTVPGWMSNQEPSPNVSMTGICFLENKQFRGSMETNDILGLRWVEKKTHRTPLSLKDENTVIAVMVMNKIKSSIRPKLDHGKPVFDIKVSMQATVPQLSTSLQKRELEQRAEKEIKNQIMNTYLKGLDMDVDVYGLSSIFYRNMSDEWTQLSTKERIPLDVSSIEQIDIKVNLVSGGISKMR
ncbi:Ger(x)C family germination protein [Paenibacillus anaericanus]|uniref:Ger(x)C family spore germination protein n=1 Tax=Paenibacillus anaericanus TaxID=170367 RepID=UPI002780E003|nr:Ger(x)C family spore germination protein [Paenibacillus anaericanus]MDQ0088880.1 Ger(x)C family germination protein [Paenibacillus anaericanus]